MNKIAFAGTDHDFAVRARNLRKVYRLYRKPSHRLRDILGLLPNDSRYFSEQVALHDMTLDIRRGEKVAIIGRNGAGKSTLLRLITRVVQPTAGLLSVNGETQALLSLGTGFHPEMTGRQNVQAYLANFGIFGDKAARMLDEIVDFSELEEYIDQPTKTYSTGMNVRLMFAASTMFLPDLLVIDEVLGVGDAYFQGKSFERIREICTGKGTTLLLVTHDVYTASSLCERMIWLDHGAIVLDADSPTVLRAYDTSVRQQEEARLRKKALLGAQRITEMARRNDVPVLIELRSPENAPLPSPVAIARVALIDGERAWPAAVVDEAGASAAMGRLVKESGSWGDVVTWQGRQARQMNHYGSAIHKVGICFFLPAGLVDRADQMRLEVELGSDQACRLEVWRIDADVHARRLVTAETTPGEWILLRTALAGETAAGIEKSVQQPTPFEQAPLPAEDSMSIAADQSMIHVPGSTAAAQSAAEQRLPKSNTISAAPMEHHGSGRVVVTGVRILDDNGREALQLEHGKPVSIIIGYQINDAALKEHCQVVLAFRRNGVEDVFRLFGKELLFDASTAPQGEIVLRLDRMPLGAAEYSLTILVAAENYYEERPTTFYTVNPKVYWAAREVIDIKVVSNHLIPKGTGVVGEASWSLR